MCQNRYSKENINMTGTTIICLGITMMVMMAGTINCDYVISHTKLYGFDNQCADDCEGKVSCFISCDNENGADCWMRGRLNNNEAFYIVTKGRKRGDKIKYGDQVGLYHGDSRWLSCDCGGWCTARTCPGNLNWTSK